MIANSKQKKTALVKSDEESRASRCRQLGPGRQTACEMCFTNQSKNGLLLNILHPIPHHVKIRQVQACLAAFRLISSEPFCITDSDVSASLLSGKFQS